MSGNNKVKEIKAYKAFHPDMTCINHHYEVGKSYELNGEPYICHNGFHASVIPFDVFRYYDATDSLFAKVTLSGTIIEESDKMCASQIHIDEMISIVDLLNDTLSYFRNLKLCMFSGLNKHQYVCIKSEDGKVTTDYNQDIKLIYSDNTLVECQAGSGYEGHMSNICVSGIHNRIYVKSGDVMVHMYCIHNDVIIDQACKAVIHCSGSSCNILSYAQHSTINSSGAFSTICLLGTSSRIVCDGTSSKIVNIGTDNNILVGGFLTSLCSYGEFATITVQGTNHTVSVYGLHSSVIFSNSARHCKLKAIRGTNVTIASNALRSGKVLTLTEDFDGEIAELIYHD